MAFRRVAFEKYGLFRTDLGISGSRRRITGGDTEFGNRLLRGGEKIVYSPKAVVLHPVVQLRITKNYFLEYYFCLGRTNVRQERWPAESVLYFGVPRYLFRELLGNGAQWLVALNRKKKFYYKAQKHWITPYERERSDCCRTVRISLAELGWPVDAVLYSGLPRHIVRRLVRTMREGSSRSI